MGVSRVWPDSCCITFTDFSSLFAEIRRMSHICVWDDQSADVLWLGLQLSGFLSLDFLFIVRSDTNFGHASMALVSGVSYFEYSLCILGYGIGLKDIPNNFVSLTLHTNMVEYISDNLHTDFKKFVRRNGRSCLH